jgi:ankyrin repeat protein
MTMNINYTIIGIAVFMSVEASASDPMSKIQDMLDDLGGNMALVGLNNGRIIKCSQGGTKKVTIRFNGSSAVYVAQYDNCRENNKVRDSMYVIETYDEEVLKDEEKPTKNRELFDAAASDNIQVVRNQLNNNADANTTYNMPVGEGVEIERWTPLMSAAANGNLEIVKLLVKQGAWINFLNSDVRNALWYATNAGSVDVVKLLLENGGYANNSDFSNTTPLMMAAINGDTEIVRLLTSHKVQIDSRHKDGDTALIFAAANGRSDIARLLIDAGADVNVVNNQGITALIACAAENNIEIAEYLLRHNANRGARTNFGKTALDIAVAKRHVQLIQLLSEVK